MVVVALSFTWPALRHTLSSTHLPSILQDFLLPRHFCPGRQIPYTGRQDKGKGKEWEISLLSSLPCPTYLSTFLLYFLSLAYLVSFHRYPCFTLAYFLLAQSVSTDHSFLFEYLSFGTCLNGTRSFNIDIAIRPKTQRDYDSPLNRHIYHYPIKRSETHHPPPLCIPSWQPACCSHSLASKAYCPTLMLLTRSSTFAGRTGKIRLFIRVSTGPKSITATATVAAQSPSHHLLNSLRNQLLNQ